MAPIELGTIDRNSVLPLYFQIQQRLLGQIRGGSFKPGESLPSEQEIAEQLGVSRMTAHQALKSLRDLGVTYSVRGKGTFVSGIKLEKDFRQVLSFTEEMQAKGMRPKSKVLSFVAVPADDEVAGALHLAPGEKVISLRRIRIANGSPLGIEWSRIPQRLCPDLIDKFDPSTSLYEALERQFGIRLMLADEIIEAGLPNAEEGRLLRMSRKNPVFQFTRTSFVQSGEATEFVKSVYRADRYKIANRLTRFNRELLTHANAWASESAMVMR